MKSKEEFLQECNIIRDEVMKYDDGCFHLQCENCNEGFMMFEGTFNALYKKYLNGCFFCKSKNLILKVGHVDL